MPFSIGRHTCCGWKRRRTGVTGETVRAACRPPQHRRVASGRSPGLRAGLSGICAFPCEHSGMMQIRRPVHRCGGSAGLALVGIGAHRLPVSPCESKIRGEPEALVKRPQSMSSAADLSNPTITASLAWNCWSRLRKRKVGNARDGVPWRHRKWAGADYGVRPATQVPEPSADSVRLTDLPAGSGISGNAGIANQVAIANANGSYYHS